MSLHLLPALSLGARLDEIERTARELFGSAVTISAETESPYTRSDEAPKPDKAIKVVIKIELPGAFPKLVSEQACPGGRASPAMEIGEPSSRASSSEGACAASSALDPTLSPATTTSSDAPSVFSSYESALERCVRDIEDAYTRREPGVAIKAVPSWPIASIIAKHFPYDPDALRTAQERQGSSEQSTSRPIAPAREAARAVDREEEVAGSMPAPGSFSREQREGAERVIRGHLQRAGTYADPEEQARICGDIAGIAHLFCSMPHDPDFEVKDESPKPGVTRLRVRGDSDYVARMLRSVLMRINGIRGLDIELLDEAAEALAKQAIELLGQDAGTQRAPVKLPLGREIHTYRANPEAASSWNHCLAEVRKALAEAGVEVAQ